MLNKFNQQVRTTSVQLFLSMFLYYLDTRTLRSNTMKVLQIPHTDLKRFDDRAFYAYAPRLWNGLPDNMMAADSVQNFNTRLETLLFQKEFI